MRYTLVYVVVLCSSAFLSCSKARIGVNTYDIEHSNSAIFDQNKKLTFEDVVSDSRCPDDVSCVWPGEAVIALRAICSPGDTLDFVLTFGDGINDHRDTTIFEIYKVELLEVLPPAEKGIELEKQDYSIRVLIEKS